MRRFGPRPGRLFLKFLVGTVLLVAALVLAALGFVAGVLSACSQDLPDVERLSTYQPSLTTKIYASDGTLIGTLYQENRTQVSLKKVSPIMRQAIVAIEDRRFYQHRGVDPYGVARAALADLTRRRTIQGASTITQQLARNIFLSPRRTWQRKIQEALLAIQIERRYTKDEILEMYLNKIYFGAGAYGIEAAAQNYFGRHAWQLNLAQASVLAGLPQAPTRFSPYVDKKAARSRQEAVLDAMVNEGTITRQEAEKAFKAPLRLSPPRAEFHTLRIPYFTTYVLHELFSRYSAERLMRGGLKVYTTLDRRLQTIAQKAVAGGVARARYTNGHQGALVALDPRTGYIRALVGGVAFAPDDQFNRAWQAYRQPGSAFKVFVYTTAIDNGYTPDTVVPDSPVSFPDGNRVWSPKNSDGKYIGAVPLRIALKFSRNVVSVKLVAALGPQRVIDYAYRMGIRTRLTPVLSIALGSSVVTPLEMASAFGVLGHHGVRVEPTAIKKVVDPEGNVLEDNTYPQQEEVLSERTAYTMVEMMKGVIEGGTGTRARIGRPAAGKTGTTDDYRDTWFVGFVPQLACAVWVGNDDFSRMYHAFGGVIPASIWADFMKQAMEKEPKLDFPKPTSEYQEVLVCLDSGKRAVPECPRTEVRILPASAVLGPCPIHGPKHTGTPGATSTSSVSPRPSASAKPTMPTEEVFPGATPPQTASPGASPGPQTPTSPEGPDATAPASSSPEPEGPDAHPASPLPEPAPPRVPSAPASPSAAPAPPRPAPAPPAHPPAPAPPPASPGAAAPPSPVVPPASGGGP